MVSNKLLAALLILAILLFAFSIIINLSIPVNDARYMQQSSGGNAQGKVYVQVIHNPDAGPGSVSEG